MNRKLNLEHLETRAMFHGDELDICTSPIPLGPILPSESNSAITTVPVLSSNPSATKKLFLDFDGNSQPTWGSFTNVNTPPYNGSVANMEEIWRRVSEDYSIFDIDVTTIDPGNTNLDYRVAIVRIGGSYYDWYGSAAGGVAYVGGFYYSFLPNDGFVFSSVLGSPKHVAEAASHEAGHLFGLRHQSVYDGNGNVLSEYYSGFGDWAPIMGNSYYAPRSTWWNNVQNDIAGMTSLALSLRSDDYPSDNNLLSTNFNINGILGVSDSDIFEFTTTGGLVNLNLDAAYYGNNTDLILRITNTNNNVLFESNPTNSYSANLSVTLNAGTYKVVALTTGGYGNIGQYNLNGNFPLDTIVNATIDNGDANFSKSNGWINLPIFGFQNDSSLSLGMGGNATWTFNNIVNGTYDVFATWKGSSKLSLSTSVNYNINGVNSMINQRVAPNDLIEDGTKWGKLGVITVTNGKIIVKLTNNTNGWMEADAIKIKKV